MCSADMRNSIYLCVNSLVECDYSFDEMLLKFDTMTLKLLKIYKNDTIIIIKSPENAHMSHVKNEIIGCCCVNLTYMIKHDQTPSTVQ